MGKPFVATLEEHYSDAAIVAKLGSVEGSRSPLTRKRLEEIGEVRLSEMDAAGVDVQVISHAAPAMQQIGGDDAVQLAREANDRLGAAVARHPTRFAGFATLPTSDPLAAADELARTVEKLGFKGVMLHGLSHGRFLDEADFWPIFARAEALDVPVYIHPAQPHPAVEKIYYKAYSEKYPIFARAALGFTVEGATQAIRLVLSGIFDRHPDLKIILGHFGESLPYCLWRIEQTLSRPGNFPRSFREIFCRNFYVTTSGNFSTPALLCSMMEMGSERILFSVDWPFVSNTDGVQWLNNAPLSNADRRLVFGENARRILKL